MNRTITRVNRQNAWEYKYENGAEVLVSYATPVAAYIPGLGFIETTTSFSRTTSKQTGQWRQRMGYPLIARVEQREIEGWLAKLDGLKMWGDSTESAKMEGL